MDGHTSFSSLVIVTVIAFITPILLNRLRLNIIPVVVAEIIAGIIIGKTGFNLVGPDNILETLSTLGFIYLLFLSGVEIDFSLFASRKKHKKNEKRTPNGALIAIAIFLLILIISFGISQLFLAIGLIKNPYLMTLVISTISLGIVVPTLKDANIIRSEIGQTILLITVVGDLMTMVLLAVFVSLNSQDGGNTWLLLILFGSGIILYFFGKLFKHLSFLETLTKGTVHIDTRAVFTLIIVLVGLAESLGAENILGAFLAGVLVSLLSPDPNMVQKLDSFGYGFLIPIFFVMVGVKLDLISMFSHASVLLIIPLLLVAFFIAKMIPALLLKRWYDWRTVFSVGSLISAKLTLVIAAAKIGERMDLITGTTSSAIILVGVLSSILGPIIFKKLFPLHQDGAKSQVVFIGANQLTLPISLELDEEIFDTTIYHTKKDDLEEGANHTRKFTVKQIANYDLMALYKEGVFEADILVIATGKDETNARIAKYAEKCGTKRIIARIEKTEVSDELRKLGIDIFSMYFSTKTILKAMIQSPSIMNLFTKEENGLFEVRMKNPDFNNMTLRQFPFLGDTIIVRIFRGNESIVPHGDTEMMMGDRLIVTGSKECVHELRELVRH